MTLLDDYAAKWAGLYKDSCEATHVRGEQSEELLDLRMSCLNDRLSGLRALTDVFSGATGEVVEHSVEAAHALTPLDGCSDVRQLRSIIPPPDPAVRTRVEGLRRELGQVKAIHDAGRYVAALDRLKPVLIESQGLSYRPLEAETLTRIGVADTELGRNAEAEQNLELALQASVASHHDDLLPEIAGTLVWVVGFRGRYEDADRWRRIAESSIERTGVHDSIAYCWLLNNVGVVYHLQGRLSEALEYLRRAAGVKEKLLGPDDPDVARSIQNMAMTMNALKRSAEALPLVNRSLQIEQHALGDSHPRVAFGLSNRGEILLSLARPADALDDYRKAQTIWEREVGPADPAVAYALTGIGRSLVALGRPREAIEPLERALKIREDHDPNAARLGETEFSLATALWDAHRNLEEATAIARRSLGHYSEVPTTESNAGRVRSWLSSHQALPRRAVDAL